MRQRVMIAMALVCRPRLLIADEPTTALDVTIQAQVLDLLKRLRATLGTAILIISHDMGVIADVADRVVVMYGGRVMETADRATLFRDPRHPYTRGLLAAIPQPDPMRRTQAPGVEGEPADPLDPPGGCGFSTRCPSVLPACRDGHPDLRPAAGQFVRCSNPAASIAIGAE
jgi:oligopeptide/dipeptide ABC transporter ATP-binding protein